MNNTLTAGAGVADITPVDSQFLFGYPHVERYSTGVHDPLLSSALYLSDGQTKLLFIANDIIFVPKDLIARARRRIEAEAGVPAKCILISATHTHSGPITVDYLSCQADPVVPKTDEKYLQRLEDGIVAAAVRAVNSAQPAEVGLAVANIEGVGTNRRDPAGPADPEAPVLLARDAGSKTVFAAMSVYAMHPTVLHEDSTLITGDFPGLARQHLQAGVLGKDCVFLHHTGAEGNQSPRHCVKGQTFEEADRLGGLYAKAITAAIEKIEFHSDLPLAFAQQNIADLPTREFPTVAQAEAKLQAVVEKLARQRSDGTPAAEVRTTECDWFGAEETVVLAKAAEAGRLGEVRNSCLPLEVQVLHVGPWSFVGWQGEVFIEYALAVRQTDPNAFIICMAGGELQGYIVTPEAAAEGGYEASNALFAPETGDIMVETTLAMLKQM